MMRARFACLYSALFLTFGCAASVPMAPSSAAMTATRFEPPSGMANLYVYRNEVLGSAYTMTVLLDGEPLGQTAASTYLHTPITPGRHSVVSKTAENDSGVVIEAEAGKNYFLWQEAQMGALSVRSLLQAVDEQTGRAAVAECQLAVTSPPSTGARQSTPVAGCGKDTDCKGDRVCRDGACVDAAPQAPAAPPAAP